MPEPALALTQPPEPPVTVSTKARVEILEQQVAELSAAFAALSAAYRRMLSQPGCGLIDLSARQSCTEFSLGIRQSVKPDSPLGFTNASVHTYQVVRELTRKLLEGEE